MTGRSRHYELAQGGGAFILTNSGMITIVSGVS
jgi:hypothetical protein